MGQVEHFKQLDITTADHLGDSSSIHLGFSLS
jgi:hypothetical protein